PGFSLMQEGIGYAVETETPCVIIDVMRGGPSTGQPTKSSQQDVMQARYGSHGDYEIIVLCPSSVQEVYEMTVKAFNLAEEYRVPVILLMDEIVGHTREKLKIPLRIEVLERKEPLVSKEQYIPYQPLRSGLLDGMPAFGKGYNVLVDGQLHDQWGNRAGHDPQISGRLMKRLCAKITDHIDKLTDVDTLFIEDAKSVVVSYGSVARSAISAVKMARANDMKTGLLKLNMLWPFPDGTVASVCRKSKTLIVPEMNIGKIARELERLRTDDQQIISVSKLGGEMHTPEEILSVIEKVSENM
ncbi:MAG TPA: 2-oxoacid:acceptor oxidoreductase subunit alpha, partial [Chromatiaceae bacterium]|nr:2-oxoacid:acceptor oxidoreductase subunit alpha [Chromatiaceae bacterium]